MAHRFALEWFCILLAVRGLGVSNSPEHSFVSPSHENWKSTEMNALSAGSQARAHETSSKFEVSMPSKRIPWTALATLILTFQPDFGFVRLVPQASNSDKPLTLLSRSSQRHHSAPDHRRAKPTAMQTMWQPAPSQVIGAVGNSVLGGAFARRQKREAARAEVRASLEAALQGLDFGTRIPTHEQMAELEAAIEICHAAGMAEDVAFAQDIQKMAIAKIAENEALQKAAEQMDARMALEAAVRFVDYGTRAASQVEIQELSKAIDQAREVGLTDDVAFAEEVVKFAAAKTAEKEAIYQAEAEKSAAGVALEAAVRIAEYGTRAVSASEMAELDMAIQRGRDAGLTDEVAFAEMVRRLAAAKTSEKAESERALAQSKARAALEAAVLAVEYGTRVAHPGELHALAKAIEGARAVGLTTDVAFAEKVQNFAVSKTAEKEALESAVKDSEAIDALEAALRFLDYGTRAAPSGEMRLLDMAIEIARAAGLTAAVARAEEVREKASAKTAEKEALDRAAVEKPAVIAALAAAVAAVEYGAKAASEAEMHELDSAIARARAIGMQTDAEQGEYVRNMSAALSEKKQEAERVQKEKEAVEEREAAEKAAAEKAAAELVAAKQLASAVEDAKRELERAVSLPCEESRQAIRVVRHKWHPDRYQDPEQKKISEEISLLVAEADMAAQQHQEDLEIRERRQKAYANLQRYIIGAQHTCNDLRAAIDAAAAAGVAEKELVKAETKLERADCLLVW